MAKTSTDSVPRPSIAPHRLRQPLGRRHAFADQIPALGFCAERCRGVDVRLPRALRAHKRRPHPNRQLLPQLRCRVSLSASTFSSAALTPPPVLQSENLRARVFRASSCVPSPTSSRTIRREAYISNIVDALQLIGILALDPRGFGIVSPADIAVGLSFQANRRETALSQSGLMKTVYPTIIVAIALLISACSTRSSEVWVATEETPVYASENEPETTTLFTLAAGDVCTPLRDVVIKVYQHTEIECKNGRGWVIDKQNFNIKVAS